jgi:hypothetical protein
LVVCDDERALLRFAQVAQNDHWDHLHPEFLRRQNARMPRDNSISLIHKDRIRPAELLDGRRDLSNLPTAVRAGIIDSRDQPLDQPALHLDVNIRRGKLSGPAVDVLCHWHTRHRRI